MKSLAVATLLVLACVAATRPAATHNVASPDMPGLILRVDPAFTASNRSASRSPTRPTPSAASSSTPRPTASCAGMVIVQFERVQPGSAFRFDFPATPPRRFGAQVYAASAGLFDEAQSAARSPDREAAHTRRFLAERRLWPAQVWKVARLTRVADPQGLSEVIIFYRENADLAFPAGIPANGGALDASESERLFRALADSIQAVSG
jgi:hypothetical protein